MAKLGKKKDTSESNSRTDTLVRMMVLVGFIVLLALAATGYWSHDTALSSSPEVHDASSRIAE